MAMLPRPSRFPVLPVLLTLAGTSCVRSLPMMSATPAPAATIEASRGRTWDEVLDYMIEHGISARVIDHASGFYQSIPMNFYSAPLTPVDSRFRGTTGRSQPMGTDRVPREADCGGTDGAGRYPITSMRLDVKVSGDSTRSTLRVSPLFFHGVTQCNTRGALEKDIIDRVKERTERN